MLDAIAPQESVVGRNGIVLTSLGTSQHLAF